MFQDEKARHQTKLVGLKETVDAAQSALTIVNNELSVYTGAEQKERIRLEQLQDSIQTTRFVLVGVSVADSQMCNFYANAGGKRPIPYSANHS